MVPHVLQSSHSVYLPIEMPILVLVNKASLQSARQTRKTTCMSASNDPTLMRKMSSKPILQRENENSESFKGKAQVRKWKPVFKPDRPVHAGFLP